MHNVNKIYSENFFNTIKKQLKIHLYSSSFTPSQLYKHFKKKKLSMYSIVSYIPLVLMVKQISKTKQPGKL